MCKINNKLKIIVVSLGLGVIMLTTTSVQAQMIDLLDEYYEELEQRNNQSILNRRGSNSGSYNLHNQQFSDDEGGYNLYNQFFEVPLGSGLLILTAAGAGYALKKRKSNKKK